MEAAKAFHYRWSEWLAESPILRAKMMAHELVKAMRDAYTFEQRMETVERGSGARQQAPWDAIRKQFFK